MGPWLISPLSRVVPLIKGLFMAYKLGVILTTYKSADPVSTIPYHVWVVFME